MIQIFFQYARQTCSPPDVQVDFRGQAFANLGGFTGAHRSRICVRVFIGVSVRACCECLRCTM
jgi:hypothetical protein